MRRLLTTAMTTVVGLGLTTVMPVAATSPTQAQRTDVRNTNVNQNYNQVNQTQVQSAAQSARNRAPAPRALPNSGAGSMLGIFAVSSVVGMLGYRRHLAQRLSLDS